MLRSIANQKLSPLTQKEKELNAKIEAQKKADAQKKAEFEKKQAQQRAEAQKRQAEQKAAIEKAKKDAEARSAERQKAIEAIKLIFENIELAYKDGTNLEARTNMLKAAYLAGIAFSKSYVGYCHAVAHSLGGKYNTPHGLANAVLLPHILDGYGKSSYKKL